MEKIKLLLNKINVPMVSFLLLSARAAILGSSISDAIALAAIGSIYGFHSYLKHQQIKKYNEQFEADVKIEFTKAAEEIQKLKNVLSGLNMASAYSSGVRKMTNPNG